MTKRNSTKVISIIAGVMCVVLFVGALTVLFDETDNLTTSPGSIYVEVDGERISKNKEDHIIVYGNEYRFDVGYTLEKNTHKEKFFVDIVPNITEETSFDFIVGDDIFAYEGVTDLEDAFNLKVYDGYFTIHPTKDLSEAIQDIFPDKEISGVPGTINSNISYYKIIVSNENKTKRLEITFQLAGRVMLDRYEVIF